LSDDSLAVTAIIAVGQSTAPSALPSASSLTSWVGGCLLSLEHELCHAAGTGNRRTLVHTPRAFCLEACLKPGETVVIFGQMVL
jgi:hypothetical protein